MKSNRQMLEQELAEYQELTSSLSSYVHELKDKTASCGTDPSQFESDLFEAENDLTYYHAQITRLKTELTPAATETGPTRTLTWSPRQGVGALIFSSIGFVAGALLGSKLKSRKHQ